MATTNKTDGMQYEQTGKSTINNKAVAIKIAKQLPTYRLLWILLTRHKTGILATGNIILVLNWAIPAWPEIIKSLI